MRQILSFNLWDDTVSCLSKSVIIESKISAVKLVYESQCGHFENQPCTECCENIQCPNYLFLRILTFSDSTVPPSKSNSHNCITIFHFQFHVKSEIKVSIFIVLKVVKGHCVGLQPQHRSLRACSFRFRLAPLQNQRWGIQRPFWQWQNRFTHFDVAGSS